MQQKQSSINQEKKRTAGTMLRWQREERGWSLQELVKQLGRLYQQENDRLCPLTISMVGKWERDEHLPSPIYRKLFCLLYRQTASELGFLAPWLPAIDAERESAEAVIPVLTP